MISETGWVTRVEPGALWVETIQRSTCDSCSAKKGCGQRVLAQLAGHTAQLRVLLPANTQRIYRCGDEVEVAIAEHAVVASSLLIYLLPLFAALLLGGVVESFYPPQLLAWKSLAIAAAVGFGLVIGALWVHAQSGRWATDQRFVPVLLEPEAPTTPPTRPY